MTFRHNIPFTVNLSAFSLDIRVMINILYEMITILDEKMLNVICKIFSLNHNDTLAENNLLNSHSNET